ncbi:hypothetical protein EK904_014775 [Melospiza melodia maxima]|nr:hypothetical protein EK904_014775 [Melospiza melodia maxima]
MELNIPDFTGPGSLSEKNGISSCLLFNQHLQPALIKQPGRHRLKVQTNKDTPRLLEWGLRSHLSLKLEKVGE